MKESICTVLGSLIDSLSRQIMLRKVTLMALLGVAVADVSPYTSNYDPVQHHFGVRQDGVDPLVAGLGVVSPLLYLIYRSNQPSMKVYHKYVMYYKCFILYET